MIWNIWRNFFFFKYLKRLESLIDFWILENVYSINCTNDHFVSNKWYKFHIKQFGTICTRIWIWTYLLLHSDSEFQNSNLYSHLIAFKSKLHLLLLNQKICNRSTLWSSQTVIHSLWITVRLTKMNKFFQIRWVMAHTMLWIVYSYLRTL